MTACIHCKKEVEPSFSACWNSQACGAVCRACCETDDADKGECTVCHSFVCNAETECMGICAVCEQWTCLREACGTLCSDEDCGGIVCKNCIAGKTENVHRDRFKFGPCRVCSCFVCGDVTRDEHRCDSCGQARCIGCDEYCCYADESETLEDDDLWQAEHGTKRQRVDD